MNEFLKLEYEKCIDLIKYYDERHHSLLRFAVGITSGVPTLMFGFYALGQDVTRFFWEFFAFIAGASILGLTTVFAALVQNRLYFIFPARQANAIRHWMLETDAADFHDNKMYVDSNFSAFNWMSAHSLLNGLVALQIGLFSAFLFFSLNVNHEELKYPFFWAAAVGIGVAVAVYFAAAVYLIAKSRKSADHAVHCRR